MALNDEDTLRKRKPQAGETISYETYVATHPNNYVNLGIDSAIQSTANMSAPPTCAPAAEAFAHRPRETPLPQTNLYVVVAVTLVAGLVRLYRISNPSQVVFDEVHFGGFASKYIQGKFFMDVHPPLGKLLIAASAVLAGFDGSFDFKSIGLDYLEPKVPYVAMRMLPGILGVLLVPVAYMTMRNLRVSNVVSIMTAVLLIFENGLACQSRAILLDSILLFFMGLALMTWTDFLNLQKQPFSFAWWFSLASTGLTMGLAASVKWVGLFVIATIGFSTIANLWALLGDLRVTPGQYAKHFFARVLCLIIVPIAVYMTVFGIHFLVLTNTGSGTAFMSPEFQSTLRGSEIKDTFAEVGFGADILIRHENTKGGYLHSHKHYYRTGSKQQQVTLYSFADDNSLFQILPALVYENGTARSPAVTQFQPIKHGDIVRLEHVASNMRLHSHEHRAPVTDNEDHYEVSAYGAPGFLGDSNDHWRVELVDYDDSHPHLLAIESRFRLVHVNLHCTLFSRAVKLPEWGFGQQEVTCANHKGRKDLTYWRIDLNQNLLQNPFSRRAYYKKPSFLSKFIESHKVMWKINDGLNGYHPFQSRPDSWPVLGRGISFWSAKEGTGQMYLVGNPFIWFSALVSLGLYVTIESVAAILQKRGHQRTAESVAKTAGGGGPLLFLGWALHYFPFFLMGRQLFLHHYFPSFYFSVLLLGSLFEGATRRFNHLFRSFAVLCICTVAIYVYINYSPLTYGIPMSKEHCKRLKWRQSWDWDCKKQLDDPIE